jgi:hypothetical protein
MLRKLSLCGFTTSEPTATPDISPLKPWQGAYWRTPHARRQLITRKKAWKGSERGKGKGRKGWREERGQGWKGRERGEQRETTEGGGGERGREREREKEREACGREERSGERRRREGGNGESKGTSY